MNKFMWVGEVLINPDHVASVQMENGKIAIHFAIPEENGHYILRIKNDERDPWGQFVVRMMPKSRD